MNSSSVSTAIYLAVVPTVFCTQNLLYCMAAHRTGLWSINPGFEFGIFKPNGWLSVPLWGLLQGTAQHRGLAYEVQQSNKNAPPQKKIQRTTKYICTVCISGENVFRPEQFNGLCYITWRKSTKDSLQSVKTFFW
jgi:hypothetical protein